MAKMNLEKFILQFYPHLTPLLEEYGEYKKKLMREYKRKWMQTKYYKKQPTE